MSAFHSEYGYYPQGVEIRTAVLPEGWYDRLIIFETPDTKPGRGLCLERHDLVLAKLVRFDAKDQDFAVSLVRAGLIDLDVLAARAEALPAHPGAIERIRVWIGAMRPE